MDSQFHVCFYLSFERAQKQRVHLGPRSWFLNIIPDEKEISILGKMNDCGAGATNGE